jgi:hypothetical protein
MPNDAAGGVKKWKNALQAFGSMALKGLEAFWDGRIDKINRVSA